MKIRQNTSVRHVLVAVLMLVPNVLKSNTVRVAILDDGKPKNFVMNECKNGNINFTKKSMISSTGHGENIASIIKKEAKNSKYCVVYVKFYDKDLSQEDNVKSFLDALRYISSAEVDIVNISAGGATSVEEEKTEIKKILDKGVVIVAAAGNTNDKLTIKKCNYFPACYDDRILVIGAKDVDLGNKGEKVTLYETGVSGNWRGTSQATAIFTGKLIKHIYNIKLKNNTLQQKPNMRN